MANFLTRMIRHPCVWSWKEKAQSHGLAIYHLQHSITSTISIHPLILSSQICEQGKTVLPHFADVKRETLRNNETRAQ